MTDADKTRIEIEKEADLRARKWLEVQYTCAKTEYIAGATVWAERLKQERNKAIDEAINEFSRIGGGSWNIEQIINKLKLFKS